MTQPVPDEKDWTWTLTRQCPECGLTAGEVDFADIADRTEAAAAEWVQILTANPAASRRPAPQVWSPLEYGAHVRDVFQIFDARMALMLSQDTPTFDNWNQDEAALSDDYAAQDPDDVAEQLLAAAQSFTARIRAVEPSQLSRRGNRTGGSAFTVLTLGQYFVHDLVHHLWDVTGQRAVE